MKIGKICKNELIKTREELEMMKNGLINVFNLSITNHTEIMNFKNCRRSLKETLERTHNKTVRINFRKSIFKWNIPQIERYNKMSVRSSIMNIPLKYSFSKLDNKVIELGLERIENFAAENSENKVVAREVARTGIIPNTLVIREIRALEPLDHG